MPRITRWTCIASLVLIGVGIAPRAALGQSGSDTTKRALAIRIMAVTKVTETMVAGMEASLPAQRAASPQVPAEFWDMFLTKAKASADSLALQIVPIYVELFSEDDLRTLLAFYETPFGQRLVQRQPQLFARSAQVGQQWGTALGLSVANELMATQKPPETPSTP